MSPLEFIEFRPAWNVPWPPKMKTRLPVGYEFANFKLDVERLELLRGHIPLRIEPKVFDVLLYLIECRQRVVERQELLSIVWEGNTVCYHALPQCIWRLRSLLEDRQRRIVQTVPRVGYRFGLPVRPVHASSEGASLRTLPAGELLSLSEPQ